MEIFEGKTLTFWLVGPIQFSNVTIGYRARMIPSMLVASYL